MVLVPLVQQEQQNVLLAKSLHSALFGGWRCADNRNYFPPNLMSETTVKTGEVNLAKLVKRTKFHPKGRVQLDENGEIKNPKNPTAGKANVEVLEDGQRVTKEIDRYAGMVTGEGTVWRIAMCKPEVQIAGQILKASCPEELYDEMTKLYEKRKTLGKGTDDFRPELSDAEMEAYLEWKKKGSKKSE